MVIGENLLLYFAFKRSRVKQLVKRLIRTARPETLKRIRLIGCCSFCCFCLVIVTQETLACFAVQTVFRDHWATLRAAIQMLPTQMHQFSIAYPTLYIVVLRLVADADVAQLETMMHRCSSTRARKLLTERFKTVALWQEFEQLFNIVPFMVMAILYHTIPGFIVGLIRDAQMKATHFPFLLAAYTIFHVVILTHVLLLVFSVTRAQNAVSQASERLIRQLQQQSCSSIEEASARHSLEQELRHPQSLTGWHMFTIDPSLLLSFAASVISFSVLLIQLQDHGSQARSA